MKGTGRRGGGGAIERLRKREIGHPCRIYLMYPHDIGQVLSLPISTTNERE